VSAAGSREPAVLRSNEVRFSSMSGWSKGRSALYFAHPRHGRQGIKSTHSSRKAVFLTTGPGGAAGGALSV
jgi:hypothetical protein